MGEAIGSATNGTHEGDGALNSAAHLTGMNRLITNEAIKLAEQIMDQVRSGVDPLPDSMRSNRSVSPEEHAARVKALLGDYNASSADSSSI